MKVFYLIETVKFHTKILETIVYPRANVKYTCYYGS